MRAALLLLTLLAIPLEADVLAPAGHDETSVVSHGSRVVAAAIRSASSDQAAWIDLFVSDDGGLSWSAPIGMTATFDDTFYPVETDPTLVTFDDGTFGLAFIALKQPPSLTLPDDPELLVFTRSADGREWSEPQVLSSGTAVPQLAVDRPFLAEDAAHGVTYLLYTSSTSGADVLMLASSRDRGAHWSSAVAVNASTHITAGQIAVTAGGTVVIVGTHSQDSTLVRIVSSDGGASWTDALVIGANVKGSVSPVSKTFSPPLNNLASWRDHVYCAYPATDGVFFTYSADDGRTWSPSIRLGGARGDAVLPAIAVDPASGDALVSWLDGREDVDHAGTLQLYGARFTSTGTLSEAPRAFTPSFDAGGRMGDINGSAAIGRAAAVTVFSTKEGELVATRLQFDTPPLRRAVRH